MSSEKQSELLEGLESILDSFIPKTKPPKSPLAIFICGVSGSGKTSIINQIKKEFKLSKFAYINPDEVIMKLPYWKKTHDTASLYPLISSVFLEEFEERVFKSKHHFIYDKVCRFPDMQLYLFPILKKLGYTIKYIVNYVSLETSKKRVHERAKTEHRDLSDKYIENIYKTIQQEYSLILKKHFRKWIDEIRFYNMEKEPRLILQQKGNIITCDKEHTFYINLDKFCK